MFISDVTYNDDVALLKVKPKDNHGIVFNDHIQPACLPTAATEYTEGKRCLISGWGKTTLGKVLLLWSIHTVLYTVAVICCVVVDTRLPGESISESP